MQRIVHRCVLSEQFADFSAARRVRDKKREHDKEVATRLRSNLALPVPRTFEGIFKRSICDHFRKLSESSLFFSLPALQDGREAVGYEFVDCRVDQCANADQQRELSELSHEVPISDLQEPALPGHVVFRVLHGRPERWKLAPAPLALKPLFDKDSCVVTLREIVHNDAGNPAISFGSQTVPQLLSGLETCSLDVLRRDLQVWKLSSVVNYALPCPGFPSSQVTSCVTALLDAKGVPDEPYAQVPAGAEGVCQQLQQCNYIKIAPVSPAHPALLARLTELGMTKLRVVSSLHEPQPVCSFNQKPYSQCDLMEFLLALEDQGWAWKKLPSKTATWQSLVYSAGDRRRDQRAPCQTPTFSGLATLAGGTCTAGPPGQRSSQAKGAPERSGSPEDNS